MTGNFVKKLFAKKEVDEELLARKEFKEMCIYILFLIVTTAVTVSTREIGMFYFNHTVERLFLSRSHLLVEYEELVTLEDWWLFTETTFIESIRHLDTPKTSNESSPGGSILLGLPRLRQIRVRNETCQAKVFQYTFETCYGPYKEHNEETGIYFNTKHSSQRELASYTIRGNIADYIGGGFVETLTTDHDENENILKSLQDSTWIDGGTRAVLIEFVLFNNNVNLFCNVKLLTEIPATGGLYTLSMLQSLKSSALWNEKDIFIPLCSIIFFALIFYYTFRLIQEIIWVGFTAYIRSMFHLLGIINLVFGYQSLIYVIWHSIHLKSIFMSYNENRQKFFSLDVICLWNLVFIDSMGLMVFIVWIGVLQYIKFNKTLVQFSITLQRCTNDLLGFGIMFSIVFIGYAYFAVLLFGAALSEFDKFSSAVITLIRTLLGDFDYDKLEKANRVLGPIFFLSFILFVFFILMNMFLAIIIDTYSDVKSEITHGEDNRFEEYLKALFKNLKSKVLRAKKTEEIVEPLAAEEPVEERVEDRNPSVENATSIPSGASMPAWKSEGHISAPTWSPRTQYSLPIFPSQGQGSSFREEILNSLFEVITVDKEDTDDSLDKRVADLERKLENQINKIDQILVKIKTKQH